MATVINDQVQYVVFEGLKVTARQSNKHQDINNYFDAGLKAKNGIMYRQAAFQAISQIDEINNKLNQCIELGYVEIAEKSKQCKDLFIQQKINKEQEKAISLRIKKEELERQLMYLNMQMGSSKSKESDDEIGRPLNILRKQDHEKLVKKMIKERAHSEMKRKKYQQQLQKKILEEQLKQKKSQEILAEKQKQQRRKKIQNKLKEQEELKSKKLNQQTAQNKKLEDLKQQKFLYQKIQEQYNSNILIPQLQQKKKKLKQIRQISRGFNTEELKIHQRQYLKKREESIMNKSKIQQNWTYKAPEKTERLAKIIEEENIAKKQKLEEKKKQIEDRINKQEAFIQQLKEKFIPKIDPAKREQIENRNKKDIKKEGLGNKIAGMNYLEEAKKASKKNNSHQRPNTNKNAQHSESQDSRLQLEKKSNTNYLVSSKNREQYEQIRRKRLEKILNSEDINPNEKIKKLQMESDKVGEEAKRKQHLGKHSKNQAIQQEAIDLLLTSIKAKIGIIDVYKKAD